MSIPCEDYPRVGVDITYIPCGSKNTCERIQYGYPIDDAEQMFLQAMIDIIRFTNPGFSAAFEGGGNVSVTTIVFEGGSKLIIDRGAGTVAEESSGAAIVTTENILPIPLALGSTATITLVEPAILNGKDAIITFLDATNFTLTLIPDPPAQALIFNSLTGEISPFP